MSKPGQPGAQPRYPAFVSSVPGQFGAQPRCPAVQGPNQSPNKEHQEVVFSKPIAVAKPKPRIAPIDMMIATNMARQKGKRGCIKDKTIEGLKEVKKQKKEEKEQKKED